ncbi:ABC transporter permease [Indiicoccus explosivorum]|uniref:ABC transporter permease n=1 Tax=Indiicoccus explosivorum TaxID=1917864 RepID=UPI000B44CEAC|nr:ABC transporter permease [Indiicoccus explosivorum]
MLKLVQNEWMKLWSKRSTWIMVLLLVLIISAGIGIMKWTHKTQNIGIEEDWEQIVMNELQFNESQLLNPELSEVQLAYYEGLVEIGRYRLAEDVPPFEPDSMQQQILNSYTMLSLVTLFTVIAAAGIVAAEFSQGTIKMLLTRPVSRWKILTSKYLAVLLFGLLLIVITVAASAAAGFFFLGIGEGQFLAWNGSEVVEASFWSESLRMVGLSSVSVLMITTFAFMIGTVFRSSSLAIGLSIFLLFAGTQVVFLLADFEIVKYYLFTHIDLTQFYTGFMPVPDITLALSVTVLIAYFLVFLIISYWTFSRRDTTA